MPEINIIKDQNSETFRDLVIHKISEGDKVSVSLPNNLPFTQARSFLTIINTVCFVKKSKVKLDSEKDYYYPPLHYKYAKPPRITKPKTGWLK